MTAKTRTGLPVSLVLTVLALATAAQIAGASHPRPKGATPLKVPLVPAYKECTAPNRTHGPPLDFPSCSPPAQASDFLTVGTPDANGAPANSTGVLRLDIHVGAPGPPNDTAVIIKVRMSDVRCKAGTSACGNANADGGPDYTGELQGDAMLRISDHDNAVDPGGGTDPATVVDIPFPVNMFCANTADTSTGAVCNANAYCPLPESCAPEGDRVVVGMTHFEVFDGGPDGIVATEDNTLFAAQGLFVP